MPVYKNNTLFPQKFTVKDKSLFSVEPGKEIVSQFFTTNTNLTLVTEVPYYNRVVAVNALTGLSATAQSVAISPVTEDIMVVQITGTVTVYKQNVLNTPAELTAWSSDDPIIPIPSDGSFNTILVTGSGDCKVYQYR